MSAETSQGIKRMASKHVTTRMPVCLCLAVFAAAGLASESTGPPGESRPEVLVSPSGGVAAGGEFHDDFESYPLGEFCAGGGWEEWIGGGGTVCGEIVATPARDGQSLRIDANDDMVHRFDINDGIWEIRVWTYMPVAATGRAFVIALNVYPETFQAALTIAFDAQDDRVYDFLDPDRNTPIVRGRWVEFRAVVDLPLDVLNVWYNDTRFIADRSWRDCGAICDPGNGIQALDFYGERIGSTGIFFDDVSLRVLDCLRDPQWLCDGDVDGDGQVNPVDAGLVQAAFGSIDQQDLCNYDVDCDGQINPVDSGIVQSLFGTCDPPRGACP